MFPVVDLHCDLLAYLAMSPDRTPFDPQVRCSLPQLKKGNVILQTLAIYSETSVYSLLFGLKQLEIFLELSKQYPQEVTKENVLVAFENGSTFCIENEPLDHVFTRLEGIFKQVIPFYISLTWNGENRFGGGCGTLLGLKEDGQKLLQFLSGRGIAIDFSHSSDLLAREILEFIDKNNLQLPVMASHSNFREIHDHLRNLPDDIAKEIIHRQGLIGLIFYTKFLKEPKQLYRQIEHGLSLGGEYTLAFGADFFCTEDFRFQPGFNKNGFFDEMSDASKYPSILKGLQKEKILSKAQLDAITSKNALHFLSHILNRHTEAITR